jgi:acetylornithine deacetylase/succinyl-diaminopimelate desuccinylase family protein
METKDILKNLVNIDSRFDKSNKEIIDYIAELLKKFECTRFEVDNTTPQLYNLVVKIKGKESDSPLVFIGHTDTVLTNENWNTNPFEAIEKNGKLYGLGSTDMKAGLAAMISVVQNINFETEQDIYLIFDSDEEYSGKGGLNLVEKFSLKNARIIIPEPTDEKLIIGQKGCIDLEIETNGESLHSSKTSPEKNERLNANYKAIKICNALINYEKSIYEKKDIKYGSPVFSINYIIGGSGAANVLSDKCVLRTNRRLLPQENLEETYKEIEKIILEQDPNAKIKKLFYGGTFLTDKESAFSKKVKRIAEKYLEKSNFEIKHSWTEASVFSKWGEVIVFGPGHEEMAHKANEYCELENLKNFSRIFRELAEEE